MIFCFLLIIKPETRQCFTTVSGGEQTALTPRRLFLTPLISSRVDNRVSVGIRTRIVNTKNGLQQKRKQPFHNIPIILFVLGIRTVLPSLNYRDINRPYLTTEPVKIMYKKLSLNLSPQSISCISLNASSSPLSAGETKSPFVMAINTNTRFPVSLSISILIQLLSCCFMVMLINSLFTGVARIDFYFTFASTGSYT